MYSQKWNCAASLFPKQYYNFLSPNSYTHISVRDLYISRIGPSILQQPNMWTVSWNILIAHRHMNVGIGTEAAQFLFGEHINWISVQCAKGIDKGKSIVFPAFLQTSIQTDYWMNWKMFPTRIAIVLLRTHITRVISFASHCSSRHASLLT